ncbi:MAG TPA: hypothetical protein VLB00_07770 [Gemmatimonadales bacterium]|nr:hypothetical protein [Gemmatimonadales bacterium]
MRISALLLLACAAAPLRAQTPNGTTLSGLWQLEKGKVKADGPKTVMIRADSSASWGKETVRWRLKEDQIMIALGGEWEIYKLKLKGNRLTLSGGDLTDPITLKRVGPATPRPAGVAVPPDPEVTPPA